GDLGIPPMWLTHPSYYDREQNAKAIYLPADIDERSPWLLFRDGADVRFAVSERYYEIAHKPEGQLDFAAPETVQQFLDDEYAETTFAEHYHGFYDNRYLEMADVEALLREAGNDAALAASHAPTDQVEAIYGPALKAWV